MDPKIPLRAAPFDLADVRLGPGPFRDAMERDKSYLLRLDPDRLLHTFRLNVGLPSTAQPYGGWEAPTVELRGHTLGHYLTACALMYRSTGDPELKRRIDYIVGELARCQAASPKAGYHEGYLSAYPESFIDRVEKRQPVWAPWYTLHKIYAGLLDVYRLAGNAQALEVLTRAADWIAFRVDQLTPEQMEASLQMEFGGMNDVLASLYATTGNARHLALARAFDHDAVFDPLARGEDALDGLHANTQIPKVIGAAREYEVTGETRYRDIARFFWDRVALHRSYAIGGHSDRESFFPVTDFRRHLSGETAETCNTYNMLKLTRRLFAWEPDAREMDFYERGLYNHILASQEPGRGMFVYLMALEAGRFKTYSTAEDSFWCCVGTGMENHAQYGEAIFAHGTDDLFVNLFIGAEVDWKAKGVTLRQETAFPDEDGTRLTWQMQRARHADAAREAPSLGARAARGGHQRHAGEGEQRAGFLRRNRPHVAYRGRRRRAIPDGPARGDAARHAGSGGAAVRAHRAGGPARQRRCPVAVRWSADRLRAVPSAGRPALRHVGCGLAVTRADGEPPTAAVPHARPRAAERCRARAVLPCPPRAIRRVLDGAVSGALDAATSRHRGGVASRGGAPRVGPRFRRRR